MAKTNRVVSVGLAVLVLGGALGLGYGIREIRSRRSRTAWNVEQRPSVQRARQQHVVTESPEATLQPAEASLVVQEPSEDDIDDMMVETEEPVALEPDEAPADEPPQQAAPTGAQMPGWQAIWADLNLTEEEKARLREGFALAMRRWQSMSDDERATEMARLQSMRVRWENMTDQEREQASARMRQRFEQWRQSGQVELPELSLD